MKKPGLAVNNIARVGSFTEHRFAMLLSRILATPLLLLALATPLFSEAVKDREGAVRKDKATLENDPRWNYNDPEKAFAEAKKTGKPVLVVLRCVPCLACAGIDAQVLMDRSEV